MYVFGKFLNICEERALDKVFKGTLEDTFKGNPRTLAFWVWTHFVGKSKTAGHFVGNFVVTFEGNLRGLGTL